MYRIAGVMNSDIKIYNKAPVDFAAKVEVAAVYVNVCGKILFLQINDKKKEKGFWGVPAGKIEPGEKPLQAAIRELFEETGIRIDSADDFHSLGALYVRKPELDYVYHLFCIHLDSIPEIELSAEHCSHRWVSQKEAKALPLMLGATQALDTYFQMIHG